MKMPKDPAEMKIPKDPLPKAPEKEKKCALHGLTNCPKCGTGK